MAPQILGLHCTCVEHSLSASNLMCRKQCVEELLADDFYGIRTPNKINKIT